MSAGEGGGYRIREGVVLGKLHWGRGAERGLVPGGSNPSNGFQGSRRGWPSFQEAGGAVSWLQLVGRVRVGVGILLPSPHRHNLLKVCCPTKWEMVYSDGWVLLEMCGFVEGGGLGWGV